MPTYTVEHKETEEEQEIILPYDQFMEWLAENPDWRQSFQPLKIAYRPTGVKNTGPRYPDSWKEKLKTMKKSYRGSTINDNL